MSVLPNRRHELFAQEIAKGAVAREAYRGAGFQSRSEAATDACASRLLSTAKVQARVAELKERAAARVEISLAQVTTNLLRIADKAEQLSEAPGLAVARAAHMDVAKLNGLVVEKTETKADVNLSLVDRPPRETREEWEARRRRELEGPK